jgi:hypothetical protein
MDTGHYWGAAGIRELWEVFLVKLHCKDCELRENLCAKISGDVGSYIEDWDFIRAHTSSSLMLPRMEVVRTVAETRQRSNAICGRNKFRRQNPCLTEGEAIEGAGATALILFASAS